MRRLGIVVLIALVAVIANGLLSDVRKISMACDIDYLAKYCVGVPADHRRVMSEPILTDSELDGTLYIYEQDPSSSTGNAFEAAFRGRLSEFLCAPGLGCLLPPGLKRDCI